MFPPEIVDAFIDYLDNDKPALLTCALVSKAWVPSSRHYLFSDLYIKLRPKWLFALLSLLNSPLNRIAPFVQRLVFDNLSSVLYHGGIESLTHAIRNLPRLTTCLPHVKALCLSNCDLAIFPQIISTQLYTKLQHFTDLELSYLHFFRFSDFVDFLGEFPALEKLTIRLVNWTYTGRAVEILPPPSALITWYIYEIYADDCLRNLAEWLTLRCALPKVHTFYYHMTDLPTHHQVHSLVLRAGPSIQYLRISFPIYSTHLSEVTAAHDALDVLDVSRCTSLRSLHFKYVLLYPDDSLQSLIRAWIPALLRQISSPHLHTLELGLHFPPGAVDYNRCLDELDWANIVTALSCLQSSSLARISIITGPPVDSCVNWAKVENILIQDKLAAFKDIIQVVRPIR